MNIVSSTWSETTFNYGKSVYHFLIAMAIVYGVLVEKISRLFYAISSVNN